MRLSKIVESAFLGEITIKELTVAELDGLLNDTDAKQTMIDWLYADESMTLELITACTGIDYEGLSAVTPSALRPVIDAVKEVNPDFFARARKEMDRVSRMSKSLEETSEIASVS